MTDDFKQIINNDDLYNSIIELYDESNKEQEYELMFSNFNRQYLSYEKYLLILKYLTQIKILHDKKIETENTLDIIYNYDTNIKYRITIEGKENIDKQINKYISKKNHVVFLSLFQRKKNKIIKKEKENIVDVNEYDIRFRASSEKELNKKDIEIIEQLDESMADKIIYKYKQRTSLFFEEKNGEIKEDLTIAKYSKKLKKINNVPQNYEFEIEFKKTKTKQWDILFNEIIRICKILQQSNFLINNTTSANVIYEYTTALGVNFDTIIQLDARQPQTLEIQHVTEILPNKYSVTDKADGDRFHLMIIFGKVYLISQNLNVKYTGIEIDKEYNGTILDGEYIYNTEYNRHIFLAFDILKYKNNDVRNIELLEKRHEYIDDIVENCFIFKKQKGIKLDKLNDLKIDKIIKYHKENIIKYLNGLNSDIPIETKYPLVRKKYFIYANGIQDNEIYKYASIMWDTYTNKTIKYPYQLDGLIFSPLNQEYITKTRESKYTDYKWKLPEKNSIDFYITFKKGNIFDNSIDDHIKNKPYKVCMLHVGKKIKNEEHPVLFQEENNNYQSHLFLDNNAVRDIDGNIIQDKTVVEFYYNNDVNVDARFRWVPIRTRYDKTDAVMKYRKKYGNNFEVANKIWRSIINPFLYNDILQLANDTTYVKQMETLRKRITHELIILANKENAYFQIRTNIMKGMRQFHNWIKSNMIYTYCNMMYGNKKLSVLDFGCGKGQDNMKFYYPNIAYYVGIDIDYNGLESKVDGAISRYKQGRRTHPNFPRMYFIQADVGSILKYDEQLKSIPMMHPNNKKLLEKFFPNDQKNITKYDRINCQFMIHYLLENDATWNNFKQNINTFLNDDGYILITTFDAKRIINLLKKENNYSIYYNDDKGNKKLLVDIVKKYNNLDKNEIGTGNAIDVHLSQFQREGIYKTEYLVDMEFLEKEFKKDCNMELVETDLFENQYNINKRYFSNPENVEPEKDTVKYFKQVALYYKQDTEIDRASLKLTNLYRYYIFRKIKQTKTLPKEKIKIKKNNKKQKGGFNINNFFDDNNLIIEENKGKYTFLDSLRKILINDNYIPDSVSFSKFLKDFKILNIADEELTSDDIKKIIQKLKIYYEFDDKKVKQISDGINLIILENDCNGIDKTVYKIKRNNIYDKKLYNKIIILFENDGKYNCLYYNRDNETKGVFNMNDDIVKKIEKKII